MDASGAGIVNDGDYRGKYYLPEACTFTPPAGYAFDHWEAACGEETYAIEYDTDGKPFFFGPYIFDPSDMKTITVTACYARFIEYRTSPNDNNGSATCQVGDGTPVNLVAAGQLIPAPAGSIVTLRVTAVNPAQMIPLKPSVWIETFDPNGDLRLIYLPVARAGVVGNVYTYTFTMPDSPVKLTTGFSEPETVTFDSDGGSEVPAQIVPWSDLADRPDDPTKEGFRFLDWFAEGAEEAFDFENTPIKNDITLTAHWAQIYTVTTSAAEHGTLGADVAQAIQGETVTLTLEADAGYAIGTVRYNDGTDHIITPAEGVYAFTMPAGNVTVTATFAIVPVFGAPDFTLPAALTTIGESAFEGLTAMTIVDASNCASIGKWAFKDCTGLTQIRLPANCAIHSMAFDGCGTVYVFAPAGGTTETACAGIDNCVFVAEATDKQ